MQGVQLSRQNALRVLPFGSHTIVSPSIFASYRLGDFPTAGLKSIPWSMTETSAILASAYDFARPRFATQLEQPDWSISAALHSATRPVLIDSGAYYSARLAEWQEC